MVLLSDPAEAENRESVDWFADVQHDFMSINMLPKVCELLLQFLYRVEQDENSYRDSPFLQHDRSFHPVPRGTG